MFYPVYMMKYPEPDLTAQVESRKAMYGQIWHHAQNVQSEIGKAVRLIEQIRDVPNEISSQIGIVLDNAKIELLSIRDLANRGTEGSD